MCGLCVVKDSITLGRMPVVRKGVKKAQQMLLNRVKHTKLSQPFDVFHFNFYQYGIRRFWLSQCLSCLGVLSITRAWKKSSASQQPRAVL